MRPLAFAFALAGLVWLIGLAALHLDERLAGRSTLDGLFTDLSVRVSDAVHGPALMHERIAVVAVDDATLARFGGSMPLARENLAAIVEAMRKAGVAVVAIDILLVGERESGSGDESLAVALAAGPTVIAAVPPLPAQGPVRNGRSGQATSGALEPAAPFAKAARVGLVVMETDERRMPRAAPLLLMTPEGPRTALGVGAVSLFTGEAVRFADDAVLVEGRRLPLSENLRLPLRIARPRHVVSAAALLDGASDASGALDGRIAFLGFTATATGDIFARPGGGTVPGVEVTAAVASQLLGRPSLREDATTRRADIALAIVASLLAVLAALLLPPVAASLAVAATALAVPVVAGLAYGGGWWGGGWWMTPQAVLAGMAVPVALAALWRYLRARSERRALARRAETLGRFHSSSLADRLSADPDFLSKPEARHAAILFVDLSDHTSQAHRLGPQAGQRILAAFQAAFAGTVEKHGGVVVNYMGDGAFAGFGLVEGQDQPHATALEAAFDLLDTLAGETERHGGQPIRFRLGIATGTVMLSRLGHRAHEQITVTGDAVNMSSRLLDIAKTEGARLAAVDPAVDPGGAPDRRHRPERSVTLPIRGFDTEQKIDLWN